MGLNLVCVTTPASILVVVDFNIRASSLHVLVLDVVSSIQDVNVLRAGFNVAH